jgi:hypothetical protein
MLLVHNNEIIKEASKLYAEKKLAIKSKRNIYKIKLLLLKNRYGC